MPLADLRNGRDIQLLEIILYLKDRERVLEASTGNPKLCTEAYMDSNAVRERERESFGQFF